LVKTRIEIKDQTLAEISKELHDNIGQIISVAIMQLNMTIENPKEVNKDELRNLKEIIAKSLDEIRILSRIINKDNIINSNFIEAIESDLKRIRNLKKIDCIMKCVGDYPIIIAEHELFLYRIFQEAIHNVLKHSHSASFQIDIICLKYALFIKLQDSGRGFDINAKKSGSGLNNMFLRAKLIGAELTIESDQTGTSIELKYPLTKENEN
jgi:signal transduction histidine kinase